MLFELFHQDSFWYNTAQISEKKVIMITGEIYKICSLKLRKESDNLLLLMMIVSLGVEAKRKTGSSLYQLKTTIS